VAFRDRRIPELAIFVLAAVLHTWPLAAAPGWWSRIDNSDTALNAWAIAWVGMTIVRAPMSLFEGNIFYPEPRTLAFSEVMLPQALLGAPLTWAATDPILVYNLLAIAGFALSGFAMAWLVSRWTGDRAAGVVAGLAYAFNAHTLVRFSHLQAMHVQYLPVVFFALQLTIEGTRARWVLLLALALVLQSLTSNYLLVMSAVAVIAAAAVRPDAWRLLPLLRLAGAAALASLALAPFLYQYWLAHTQQGLVRTFDDVAAYSGTWRDWLATGSTLHYECWSRPWFARSTSANFPGFTIALLALVCIVRGEAWRDPRARMALAAGAAGAALAFGANLPGYHSLYELVPILKGIRVVSRFGWLALFAFPILAGFTLAAWKRRLGPPAGALLATTAALLVTAEALRAPMTFTIYEGVPRIYDRVAATDGIVLAELPFPPRELIKDNGPSVLYAAWHLKPLLNGYSGFTPASYAAHEAVMRLFPAPDSILRLRDIGVTHVLLHKREVPAELLARCAGAPGLTLVADEGDQVLYALAARSR
jgi:hypothetical protein